MSKVLRFLKKHNKELTLLKFLIVLTGTAIYASREKRTHFNNSEDIIGRFVDDDTHLSIPLSELKWMIEDDKPRIMTVPDLDAEFWIQHHTRPS